MDISYFLCPQGVLQKCMFKHNRKEVGQVMEFRKANEKCENPTMINL